MPARVVVLHILVRTAHLVGPSPAPLVASFASSWLNTARLYRPFGRHRPVMIPASLSESASSNLRCFSMNLKVHGDTPPSAVASFDVSHLALEAK
jgi:hypothetical protein